MSGDVDRDEKQSPSSSLVLDQQHQKLLDSNVTVRSQQPVVSSQHSGANVRHSTARRVGYAMSQAPRHRRTSGNAAANAAAADFAAVSSTYQQQIAAAAMAAAATQQCYPVPFFIQQNGGAATVPSAATAATNGFDTQFVTYPTASHLEAPFLFYDGKTYSIIPASMIPSASTFNHLGYFLTPAGTAAAAFAPAPPVPPRTFVPEAAATGLPPLMAAEQQTQRIGPLVETSEKAVQVNLNVPPLPDTLSSSPLPAAGLTIPPTGATASASSHRRSSNVEYWSSAAVVGRNNEGEEEEDDLLLCKRIDRCSLAERSGGGSGGYRPSKEGDDVVRLEKCSNESSYDDADEDGNDDDGRSSVLSDEKRLDEMAVWSCTAGGATTPTTTTTFLPNNEEIAAVPSLPDDGDDDLYVTGTSPVKELVEERHHHRSSVTGSPQQRPQQPVRSSNFESVPPQSASAPFSTSNHRKSWASLFKPGGQQQQQSPVTTNGGFSAATTATTTPASDNVVQHGAAATLSPSASTGGTGSSTQWCVPKATLLPAGGRYNPRYKLVPNDFMQLGGFFRSFECRQSAPALTPRGFYNSGNYCYVNSVLQALLACPMFFNFIGSLPVLRDASTLRSSPDTEGVPEESNQPENAKHLYAPTFISQVKRIFDSFSPMQRTSQSGRGLPMYRRNQPELKVGDALHIEDFHRLVESLWRNKALGQQEDAHEFLCHLLHEIHNECLLCMKLASSNSPSKENKSTEEMVSENDEGDSEWQEYYGKRVHIHREVPMDSTPISEIFGGCFRTSLERGGSTTSSNMEPFHSLSVDGESPNIIQALKALNSRVPVAGLANPVTKKPTKAYQSMMIEKLPPCLILHLKCFVWNKPGGVRKIFPRMTIPVDLTVPQEIMSRTSSSSRYYKLFAVIHHRGKSVNNGHYICDVFHPGLPGWIRCDDQRVTVVHSREVLISSTNSGSDDRSSDLSPFILLYRQQ